MRTILGTGYTSELSKVCLGNGQLLKLAPILQKFTTKISATNELFYERCGVATIDLSYPGNNLLLGKINDKLQARDLILKLFSRSSSLE